MLLRRAHVGAVLLLLCACSLTSGSDEHLAGGDLHCPTGFKTCGRTCVPLSQPSTGCGSPSCEPCSPSHASPTCADGACAIGVCQSGWSDCDRDPGNGCEELESSCTCHSVVLATNAAAGQFKATGLDFGAGDWTWEAWLKRGGDEAGWGFELYQDQRDAGFIYVALRPDFAIECGIRQEATPPGYNYVVTPPSLEVQSWQHIACVRSGSQLRAYVDGRLRASGVIDAVARKPTAGLIGYPVLLQEVTTQKIGPLRLSRIARYESDFVPRKRWIADEQTELLYLVQRPLSSTGLVDEAGGDNSLVILGGIEEGGEDTPCAEVNR